jgi:hypothetical protein
LLPEEETQDVAKTVTPEVYEESPETNALEILENASAEGNEIATALLRKVNNDILALIPVTNKENIDGSHYNPRTNEVVLKGNDTNVKVEEVIHALSHTQMEANPELKAEITAMLEEFKAYVEEQGIEITPEMEYAMRTESEFLGTGLTTQGIQDVMKQIPQKTGRLSNMWNKFVDTVRKLIGLPAIRRTQLEKLVDITAKLSRGERSGAPMPIARAFFGEKAAQADTAQLDRAKEMAEGGASMGNIVRQTGWFKLPDGKWRFYVPEQGWVWNKGAYNQIKDILTEAKNKTGVTAQVTIRDPQPLKDIAEFPHHEQAGN